MKFKSGARSQPGIDLTPMLDVVFLLLIFFMVSTRFEQLKEVPIELPKVGAGQQVGENQSRRLQIQADGALFLDGQTVEPAALSSALGEAKAVVLSADEAVPHGRFMGILTQLRALPLEAVTVEVLEKN